MKKISNLFIMLIMMLSLTACSVSSSKNENTAVTASKVTDEKENETVEEKKVLFDDNNIFVEYRGIEEYSSDSWIINLYVENNTDSDFYLSTRNVLINNCTVGLSNSVVEIKKGTKYLAEPNFNFVLNLENLEPYNIKSVDSINFELYMSHEILGEAFSSSEVNLSPKKAFESSSRVLESSEDKTIILNDNDILIEYRGLEKYSSDSWIVNLYIENETDSDFYVSANDVQINGFALELSNSQSLIQSGSKYMSFPNFDFIIDSNKLKSYGIESIDELSFNISLSHEILGEFFIEKSVNLNPGISVVVED